MTKDIKIVETVLRDGHQSLAATRMTTNQMLPILEKMDDTGYFALECWGGATFDACLRFLNEDPWERLCAIRAKTKKTKLQMLLRGQNVLGYKNYPDDFVELFVAKSIENGIDILRIFDALNDTRNLETAFRATKKYGGHAQGTICYTTSEVHSLDYFINQVVVMEQMGADSICIKDMAGILTPHQAFELVSGIKKVTELPIDVHTHETSGTGSMTLLMAAQAGADIIDTAISPFAAGTSQPPTETLSIALEEFGFNTGLDINKLEEIADYFKQVKDELRAEDLINSKVMDVDPKALLYQVPGGMLSNLMKQLKDAKREGDYYKVLEEVPRVRKDMGYPPLVTPLSQMVGTQAVMNILTGERYKMVPNEIKDYVKGYYGKSPGPIDAGIAAEIIGNDDVITQRPADLLEPVLPTMCDEIGDLALTDEDLLSYGSFPPIAKKFLQKRADPWFDVPITEIDVVLDKY